MSYTLAIAGLAVLILIHEAGHFFVARAVGMRPRKFYLGFPPALLKVTRGGVEYGIGVFPLGGYVKIPGMHRPAPGDLRQSLATADQEKCGDELDTLDAALARDDEDTARGVLERLEPVLAGQRMFEEQKDQLAPDAYWRQDTWRRVVVIAAGPAVNAVCALALFAAIFLVGTDVATRIVDQVVGGHPAAAAGIKSGDTILTIAGHNVTPATLPPHINATHGHAFRITVLRNGKKLTIGPLRAKKDQGVYRIGIQLRGKPGPGEPLPTAMKNSFRLTWDVISGEARGIGGLFVGHGTNQVSSIVGITRDTAAAERQSLQDYFFTIGFISLVLAILNLAPILPLDGGHIVMSLLEGIRKRPFSQLAYLRYSAIGIALLLFLVSIGLHNDT